MISISDHYWSAKQNLNSHTYEEIEEWKKKAIKVNWKQDFQKSLFISCHLWRMQMGKNMQFFYSFVFVFQIFFFWKKYEWNLKNWNKIKGILNQKSINCSSSSWRYLRYLVCVCRCAMSIHKSHALVKRTMN